MGVLGIYERAGSTDKTLKLYEGGYHDLLNDLDKVLGRPCGFYPLAAFRISSGRFTHNDGISGSAHEGNYCPPVPSVISKERGYVVEICVDGLPAFVGALDPGAHCRLPVLAACVLHK